VVRSGDFLLKSLSFRVTGHALSLAALVKILSFQYRTREYSKNAGTEHTNLFNMKKLFRYTPIFFRVNICLPPLFVLALFFIGANSLNAQEITERIARPVTARLATADEQYLEHGSFLIRNCTDYRFLTIKDVSPAAGSLVFLWSYFGVANRQQWSFVWAGNGYYRIRSESGLFLTQRRTLAPTLDPQANEDSQLWQVSETEDGFYTIKSKTNKFLGQADNQRREGRLVGFANNFTGEDRHKWHLIKWTNDGRRTTSFNPEMHAFRFVNNFSGEDIIRWGGLCGGMVYAVLDYFRAGIPVPTQTYTPANATPLQSYIWNRQNHSMWNVNEKWSELEISYNIRAAEIYRWGIQGTGGGRLEELRNTIDANRPLPLGLFTGGVRSLLDNRETGKHVVLAVGYALGRYRGDFGRHIGDFKIFAYDPNMRNRVVTLVPDTKNQCFFEVENGNAWRTYFVNTRYNNDHQPPRDVPNFPEREPEGSVRHLYAEFRTANDDLRGNNDNVSITIHYSDGSSQLFPNVNNGARWVDGTVNTVHLALNRAVRREDIRNFELNASFGTDIFSDDWNLQHFIVTTGWGGTVYAWGVPPRGTPYLHRFSGDQRTTRLIVNRFTE